MRRFIPIVLLLLFVATACGDDSSASSTTTTITTTTAAPTATTTPPTTTLPPTTVAPTTTTTTAPPAPTAADSLAAFFAAAEQLDHDIAAAAAVFNSEWDAATATVGPATHAAVDALDAVPLGGLIPPGLSSDLEVAVLAVFADLDSRVAALDGGARYEGDAEFALICLSTGADSADRFDGDLAAARARALLEPPPTATPDSEAGGILAVRMTAIHSMDWGCDSCGGVSYTSPMSVDWDAQTVLGVEFESSFHGGGWDILIYAC